MLSTFLTRSLLLLSLYTAAGCSADKEYISPAYKAYQFDTTVTRMLPVYDSLVSAIIDKLPLFQKNMNENESYQAYRYMPASNEKEVFKTLPPEAGTNIGRYYDQLGKNLIFGFDIFKDSTIKIYIRVRPSELTPVDIEENLSYYPAGTKIKKREFPAKDTILNEHWQYWVRFNKQGIF